MIFSFFGRGAGAGVQGRGGRGGGGGTGMQEVGGQGPGGRSCVRPSLQSVRLFVRFRKDFNEKKICGPKARKFFSSPFRPFGPSVRPSVGAVLVLRYRL